MLKDEREWQGLSTNTKDGGTRKINQEEVKMAEDEEYWDGR